MPMIPGGGMPPTITIPDPAAAAAADPAAGLDAAQEPSAADHLRQAIEHAQAALQSEPDDADSQQLAKVVQGLYQILAARQKQRDKVMGMDAGMRRALSG